MENYLDYLGYIASLIVLISLLMSSIKKLRWISLFGSLLFGIYGFMIGSLPTGFMNLGIAFINVYYLIKMYKMKDFLRVLPITEDNEFLDKFVEYYREDMEKYVNLGKVNLEQAVIKFYVLRNMNTVGLFVCSEFDKETLKIDLDYVIPQFRDFKMGKYLFGSQKEFVKEKGYTRFLVETSNKSHIKYVGKMGFVETLIKDEKVFILDI